MGSLCRLRFKGPNPIAGAAKGRGSEREHKVQLCHSVLSTSKGWTLRKKKRCGEMTVDMALGNPVHLFVSVKSLFSNVYGSKWGRADHAEA